MQFLEVLGKVSKVISGYIAKDYIANISQYHRIQASPGYHEAILYVRDTLKDLGYDPVIHKFPADGSTLLFNAWRVPIGWEVRDGELRVVKPEEILLGRFRDTPTLIVAHSGSKPEGIEAELVDVGTGMLDEEYKYDVSGKFVLASGRASIVHEKAVIERGAVGIIVYRESTEVPNAIPYVGLWPSSDIIGKMGLAFSISYNQALRLKKLLKRGEKVVIYGRVDSRFFNSNLEVLEVNVPGEVDEYILLIAHLCHPKYGSHDNASGSGLLLELARSVKELIGKGFKLKYGLKFLWVPEFFGTIAYVEKFQDNVRKIKAVINLDMVGANQEKTGGVLTVIGYAPFNPTFLPWLAYYSLKQSVKPIEYYGGYRVLPPIKYTMVPYIDGSDHHVFIDPIWNIPSTAFIEWPDKYYHTNLDTIDNIDPKMLEIVGKASLSLALYLATFDRKAFIESLSICSSLIRSYVEEQFLNLMKLEYNYAILKLRYLNSWITKSLASIARFAENEELMSKVNALVNEISNEINSKLKTLDELKENGLLKVGKLKVLTDERVLRRTKKCPIFMREVLRVLPKEDKEFYIRKFYVEGRRLHTDIIYFLFDGKKSVSKVFEEYYAWYHDVDPVLFSKIVDFLIKAKWLEVSK